MHKKPITNPIIAAKQNPTSRALAIKAMCAHCMGCTDEELEPGFRASIRDCTSYACPLRPLRPYRRSQNNRSAKNAEL